MKRNLSIFAAIGFAVLALSGNANADNSFSLHLEPGLATPLTSPQSDVYQSGMVLGAKGMFMLDHNISVGPSISTMYLPRLVDNGQNAGTLWQFGASARLQGDRRVNQGNLKGLLSPWIDLDAMLADTGNLQRPAFDVGVGIETPLDQNNIVWFGPFLRFTHVFQTASTQDSTLLDSRDVNVIQAGISVSFDAPTIPKKEVVEHDRIVTKLVNVSCPPPTPVVVAAKAPQKVEISEKIYFDHDSSNLRWESRDKLDAIVSKLNNTPALVFKVEGHASADGQLLHNNELSAKRAMSVVDYLVHHGVELKRLQVASFGVTMPSAVNTSKEGRERNRRTEITVTFTSINSSK